MLDSQTVKRNPAEITVDELAGVVTRLNTTPRRCLGYRTPEEAFHARLAALTRPPSMRANLVALQREIAP